MIFRYRATLPNSKIFYRIYDVPANMTLFALNKFISADLLFSPDQMILFRGINEKGKVKGEYGLFDMGDGTIDKVVLENLVKKGEIVLEYTFDLFKDRYLTLTFEGQVDKAPRISYPALIESKGHNPEQFISGTKDEYDVLEYALNGQKNPADKKSFAHDDDDLDDVDDLDDDIEEEDQVYDEDEMTRNDD